MIEAEQILQQRYRLKYKLGQNAGRQTWLAEDILVKPAEKVVIKFLIFSEEFQWQNLKLFQREADILQQIFHPLIPEYRDYFSIDENNNWFALVQEYIPGTSLKKLIENKQRFTEQNIRNIAIDILEILCYLHTLNPKVIHRDIKPSNLILGEDKRIYLIDFGAVKDSAAIQGATFTVVGTYGYAPVEQFGGRTVPASDLYALGATLIHLVTGTSPVDLPQKNMRIQFQDEVSLSPDLIRWITKLTEPDVDKRFRTAYQALQALNYGLKVNAPAEVYRLRGSRIKLIKSERELAINVPALQVKLETESLRFFFILVFFTYGITILLNPYLVFLFFGLCFPLTKILLPALGEFYLRFKQDKFVMEWKIFGIIYQKQIGETASIYDVINIRDYLKIYRQKLNMIAIETDIYEYKFGGFNPQLNDIERRWLIEEIKDWLDI